MASQDTFLRSSLANNPFFSALQFLSQNLQEKRDRAQLEEQMELERQRADEQFQLDKRLATLREKQVQGQLEAQDIARRAAEFNQRMNIPAAIQSGAIDTSALGENVNVPQAGELPPEIAQALGIQPESVETTVQGITVPSVTGGNLNISREQVERIQQNQQQAQMMEMLPILQRQQEMAQRAELAALEREARAGNAEAQRAHAETMAELQNKYRQQQIVLEQKERVKGEQALLDRKQNLMANVFGLNGPTESKAVNFSELVENPMVAPYLLGEKDIGKIVDKDERLMVESLLAQKGWQIPDPKRMDEYRGAARPISSLLENMQEFMRIAPSNTVFPEQIGKWNELADKLGGGRATELVRQMQGNVTSVRGMVGQVGNLSDRDVNLMLGAFTTGFNKSDQQNREAIEQVSKVYNKIDEEYLGTMSEEQRELIRERAGVTFDPGRIETLNFYENLLGGQ